ncbi:uncharacterized protein LOC117327146 isoform X1 [Pecten maximus]|uniref:uncharacterized protein LOC117327146 isoform X1 n=1 Tax=Pecten maximus TaxID=6579 RepID=UPI0014591B24|nr:uncharacterized protein LOC117327146 isoform X1 [Pecten maximus]XP_033739889.1 uncharacterized protein LOC117327146 isoform X1 [Pecten maximus]
MTRSSYRDRPSTLPSVPLARPVIKPSTPFKMAATDHDGIDGVSTVSNTQSCIIRRAVLPIPTHQEKSDSTYETKGTKEWTKHETKQFLCEHHTMNHTARSVRMYPRVVSLDRLVAVHVPKGKCHYLDCGFTKSEPMGCRSELELISEYTNGVKTGG